MKTKYKPFVRFNVFMAVVFIGYGLFTQDISKWKNVLGIFICSIIGAAAGGLVSGFIRNRYLSKRANSVADRKDIDGNG